MNSRLPKLNSPKYHRKIVVRHEPFRRARLTVALVSSAVGVLSLVSCSEPKPQSASGDLVSDTGYKIHWSVQVVRSGIEPVAYKITLSNIGKRALTFKPSPPDCTLILEPNSFSLTPFHRESSTGLVVDENGAVTLLPNRTCTLQLAIDDMQSPLRGSTHDCQLGIRPTQTGPVDPKNPYAVPVQPDPLKSSIFRIEVP